MFKLGVNTGFAINRYPEPEVWTSIVAEEFGVSIIQFTASLLNPSWPRRFLLPRAEKIRRLCDEKGIFIQTTFTDAFSRLNHLTSPDPGLRRLWVRWFQRLVDIAEVFGAEGVGSHFGILSFRDNDDPRRREAMLREGYRNWQEVTAYAASKGLKYVFFEPMSVPREFAATIQETKRILEEVNREIAIPMVLCLDVDHGDAHSSNPDDANPYRWLEELAPRSPLIHLKQSLRDKEGYHPFTAENNARGRIRADKVLTTLLDKGCADATLLMEFSHRERWPWDYRVIPDFKESLDYWRRARDRIQPLVEVSQ